MRKKYSVLVQGKTNFGANKKLNMRQFSDPINQAPE
jgi:hypothetical protein